MTYRLRIGVIAAASLLAVASAVVIHSPGATAQELPPLPPLPEELDPVLEVLSPTIWTACDDVGLTSTLLLLLGLPTEVTGVSDTLLGPVLGLCSLVPVPQSTTACAVDESLPPLGGLGRPVRPGAIVVTQLEALDVLLTRLLGQMAGVLAPPLAGALGCAPRPVDTSPPPPEGTLPPVAVPEGPPPQPAGPPEAARPSPASSLPPVARPAVTAPSVDTSAASTTTDGWTTWRVLLVGVALALGALGLPRVSFPNSRFHPRR